jgi:hypothetical protein
MAAEEERTLVLADETRKPSNLLESLREKRAEQARSKHYDLEVPGYAGCLVLRLGPLAARETQILRERAERSTAPDRDFAGNADTIIAACREVLGRTDRADELEGLDPEYGPVRIDSHLAELFGITAESARGVLLALFDKANAPEIAIGVAANQYIEWAGRADDELDEAFVGESPAARR